MNCGFTQDFANFIKKSKNESSQITPHMISKEAILSVQHMEEKKVPKKNQLKSLL